MTKVELRNQRVSDAKRFFEILNNPNFKYFPTKVKSIGKEKEWLRKAPERRKSGGYDFAILYGGELVGGCGINIDMRRKHIAEIGYFIDEAYWGKGITPKAVKLLEKLAFKKYGIARIQILMDTRNKASERVAIKYGYRREGVMRDALNKGGRTKTYLYAKLKGDK